MCPVRRVFVDPGSPQRDAIQEAAKWILSGGVVALPTDTLYGLAADPFSPDAVARVFRVKGRAAERALPLIAADAQQVAAHLGTLSATAARLAERFWPGPLTLLVAAPRALAHDVTRRHRPRRRARAGRRRGAGDLPRRRPAAHRDERERQRRTGDGRPGSGRADARRSHRSVDRRRPDARAAPPSTIVDVTAADPALVRAGAIPWAEILAWLNTERA